MHFGSSPCLIFWSECRDDDKRCWTRSRWLVNSRFTLFSLWSTEPGIAQVISRRCRIGDNRTGATVFTECSRMIRVWYDKYFPTFLSVQRSKTSNSNTDWDDLRSSSEPTNSPMTVVSLRVYPFTSTLDHRRWWVSHNQNKRDLTSWQLRS